LSEVTRTCVGIAGYSIAEVREWAARVVGEMVAGEVVVCGDEEIALDAAFRGGPGILVIGGTGSNVVGRSGDGRMFTAGGWGPEIADEGSGLWIGREAVRRAFRALDREVASGLMESIRVAWKLKDVGELVAVANAHPGPDFSTLAPVVVECAESGDAIAAAILDDAGVELAEQVAVVWRKMQAHGETSAEVAFTGSVVEKIARAREAMRRAMEERCVGLSVQQGAVHAMDGAMWRARRTVVSC